MKGKQGTKAKQCNDCFPVEIESIAPVGCMTEGHVHTKRHTCWPETKAVARKGSYSRKINYSHHPILWEKKKKKKLYKWISTPVVVSCCTSVIHDIKLRISELTKMLLTSSPQLLMCPAFLCWQLTLI